MIFRIIVGAEPEKQPSGIALLMLAISISDHARAIGLPPTGISASRNRGSASRYLSVRDRNGRDWKLRISDHHQPRFRGHDIPHIDIISRDGRAGLEVACGLLHLIAQGAMPWEPVEQERLARRKPNRRKGEK